MPIRTNTWNLGGHYDLTNSGQNAYVGINQLFMWGVNDNGQLGLYDNIPRSSPVQIPGTQWSAISLGYFGSFGLKTDGTLWSWGYDGYGQLAQNTSTNINYSSPRQIPGTTWSSVNTGYYNALATKTDGTLWIWGYNHVGQSGLSDVITYSSPRQIPGTQWSTAKAQTFFSYATKTDGTLWSWGYNNGGLLGQNNTTYYSSPRQIPGTQWSNKFDASRLGPVLAIKTDGTLWAWGTGNAGQLGQNDRLDSSSPVQIPGTQWKNVAALYLSGFATKTDGTLWSWGLNQFGQLGQNNRTEYASPRQIPGTQWNEIQASEFPTTGYFTFANKTDETLWTWGRNDYGQLGQNNIANRSSPVQLPGNNWRILNAGSRTSAAIKAL